MYCYVINCKCFGDYVTWIFVCVRTRCYESHNLVITMNEDGCISSPVIWDLTYFCFCGKAHLVVEVCIATNWLNNFPIS